VHKVSKYKRTETQTAPSKSTGFLGCHLGSTAAKDAALYTLQHIRTPLLKLADRELCLAKSELAHIILAETGNRPSEGEIDEATNNIPAAEVGDGQRMTCCLCDTAIWDFFATCSSSKCVHQPGCVDICLECCAKMRESSGESIVPSNGDINVTVLESTVVDNSRDPEERIPSLGIADTAKRSRKRKRVERFDPEKEANRQQLQCGHKRRKMAADVSGLPSVFPMNESGAILCPNECCKNNGDFISTNWHDYKVRRPLLKINRLLPSDWSCKLRSFDVEWAVEMLPSVPGKLSTPRKDSGTSVPESSIIGNLIRGDNLVCKAPGNDDGCLWSPDWSNLARTTDAWRPNVVEAGAFLNAEHSKLNDFRKEWTQGRPILVRNANSGARLNWEPGALRRCVLENAQSRKANQKDVVVKVIDCHEPGEVFREMSNFDFFQSYEDCHAKAISGSTHFMKLKDWPPGEEFGDSLARHEVDFNECLPFQAYTHPKDSRVSIFNLATRLTGDAVNRPDMGPKMYTAYGHPTESAANVGGVGISCTRLHCDMSDACNILMDMALPNRANARKNYREKKERLGDVGAIWMIWSRDQRHALCDFLKRNADLFRAKDWLPIDDSNPVHDQTYFVLQSHVPMLRKAGLEPWIVHQRLGDAIIVPAGCPHQVRNCTSCIKVAVDFASPESVEQCLLLSSEYRNLPKFHRAREDKLQIKTMLVHAAQAALSCITNADADDEEKKRENDEMLQRIKVQKCELRLRAKSYASEREKYENKFPTENATSEG